MGGMGGMDMASMMGGMGGGGGMPGMGGMGGMPGMEGMGGMGGMGGMDFVSPFGSLRQDPWGKELMSCVEQNDGADGRRWRYARTRRRR